MDFSELRERAIAWRSVPQRLARIGRAIGRFLGPFPPVEPGARFTPEFRLNASYGRFVFSLHALAPRAESLRQVDVHEAFPAPNAEEA